MSEWPGPSSSFRRAPDRPRRARRRLAATLATGWIALFAGNCGDRLEDPTSVTLDDILKLALAAGSTESIEADGRQTTTLTAQIPADAEPKHRKVKFETSLGTFVESGKTSVDIATGTDGRATATLRAATSPGTAIVAATVDVFRDTAAVEMERAYPTTMELETTSLVATLDGSKKPTFQALLSRADGSAVSTGTEVRFTATQEGVGEVGRFFDLDKRFSDATGKAKIGFAADTGDLIAGAMVLVTATVTTSGGGEESRTITLRVE